MLTDEALSFPLGCSAEADFARQVLLACDNLRAVLAAGSCNCADIVDVTTIQTDPHNQVLGVMHVRGI